MKKIINNSDCTGARSILLWVLLYVIIVFIAWLCDAFNDSNYNKIELAVIGTLSVLPTIVIAVIAYIQLKKLVDTSVNEALLLLDRQWRSPEIIKARTIVDEIFQIHYRVGIPEDKKDFEAAISNTSEAILKLMQPKSHDALEYSNPRIIYVLSLIELLDTIGFLYMKGGDQTKDQIKNLFSDSIIFYFEAFKRYIENAHAHKSKSNRFSNFRDIYSEFKGLVG